MLQPITMALQNTVKKYFKILQYSWTKHEEEPIAWRHKKQLTLDDER